MAKIAYKKSLMDTNITILALQKKKLMDSVNVQIYKIDILENLYLLKKKIDFYRNIKKIILYL